MLNISIEEILNTTTGKLVQGENIIINNISINSRTIIKSDLFISIQGENFDGHDYTVEAYKKGALGMLARCGHKRAVVTKIAELPPLFMKIPEGFCEVVRHVRLHEKQFIPPGAINPGFLPLRGIALKRRYRSGYPGLKIVRPLVEPELGQFRPLSHGPP